MEINILALKEYAHNIRVLYVEDDESVKTQISIFLQKFFPTIVTAKDGVGGLELYKKAEYDIVITDIMMPRMDGIEMSRKIKEINEEQIIIVTSAYNDTEKLMELIDIGVDKFVMKPIANKPFLILLYNVAKSIRLAATNKELESKLIAKAKETAQILSFLDTPIAVVENRRISMMNKAFSSLFGFSEIDEIALADIETKISGRSKCEGDIIERLEADPFDIHKVVIKDHGDNMTMRTFILRHAVLQPTKKYLLSLIDITKLEKDLDVLSKKLHTNPFTGLPNKETLAEVGGELIKRGGEFGSIVFYIKNLEHVIAWHGKEKGFDVEKTAANELLYSIEQAHFDKKPFIANFDKNFYVAICRKDDAKRVGELIASLDVTSHLPRHEADTNETVHSGFETAILGEHSFGSIDEYFAKLKQKYEKIVF